jgi:hypothetical protein
MKEGQPDLVANICNPALGRKRQEGHAFETQKTNPMNKNLDMSDLGSCKFKLLLCFRESLYNSCICPHAHRMAAAPRHHLYILKEKEGESEGKAHTLAVCLHRFSRGNHPGGKINGDQLGSIYIYMCVCVHVSMSVCVCVCVIHIHMAEDGGRLQRHQELLW